MKPVLPQHQPAAAKAARKQPLESCLLKVGGGSVLWLFLMQLTAVVEQWHPDVLPVAYTGRDVDAMNYVHEDMDGAAGGGGGSAMSPPVLPPQRIYKNNGYLRVSCNGGLNQMRSAICDMVTIARYLNLTLLVPELDKESFWADPSDFEDIFDLEHFIDSLRDEVRIVKELPIDMRGNVSVFTLPPVSWSDETYYMDKILPLFKTHEMVHFNRTDFRLANNGLPIELQKLRCRVNYEALRFTPKIQAMGDKLVSILRKTGPFVVLHLRYEMDMLSFTGCAHGCTDEEAKALTKMRHARPTWREKEIDSEKKRLKGMCPLTPEEVALVLQALGFGRETLIYIAAGEIYGGQRRLASLEAAYPKLVKKEMLLSANDLRPFQNRSSQLAALDYLVSLEGDVFIPTYGGNMAKVVEGHRRSMGFRKTILLDRRQLVELLDLHQNGALSWDQFSHAIREVHKHRSGEPARRNVIERRPKEEDYFHANPHECLAPAS